MMEVEDEVPDFGYLFLTCHFDRTTHNKYTTTMLRRRITASYSDCKSTSRANLVHKVRKNFSDATFEDQEYFHIHQPYVDRAVAQSVRYSFENIGNISTLLEVIKGFYKENLIEGSDVIKIRGNYDIMYGSDNAIGKNGYVIVSQYTGKMKKSKIDGVIEQAGFMEGTSPNSLEPREYGYLRYPDVTAPAGIVFKYWHEGLDEDEIRNAVKEVMQDMPGRFEETGRTIFATDVPTN